jgi:hypothetical protein
VTTEKTATAPNCNLTSPELLGSMMAGAVFLTLSVLNGVGVYYLISGMAP